MNVAFALDEGLVGKAGERAGKNGARGGAVGTGLRIAGRIAESAAEIGIVTIAVGAIARLPCP
jgi:hypothetical protein